MAWFGACLTQAATPERPALDYVILVTGGEVLEGLFPDSHTHFLTRTLRPLGGRCLGSVTVDDREQDLKGALHFALGKAPLVIVTGGLGPTPNDITREAISSFTGIPLREHEAVLAGMERRFNPSREPLRANLRRQALVPASGDYLTNSVGTAVGLVFQTTNATIVALPGPPRELQPMVEQQLLPFLQRSFGLRRPGASLMLRFVGLGQSQISQTLQDHVQLPPELVITSQFEAGRVDFTFALPGDTAADRAWLGELAKAMRVQLGAHLYAEDHSTLEDKVVGAFARRELTLVLVEIGTGGHVTDSLTQVAAVEQVLVGSYVAPTEARVLQLLQLPVISGSDDERLLGIVREARMRSRGDVAVLVGTPDPVQEKSHGVRVLWMGADRRQIEFPWTGASVASQALLTTRVLDWLRLQLAQDEPGN